MLNYRLNYKYIMFHSKQQSRVTPFYSVTTQFQFFNTNGDKTVIKVIAKLSKNHEILLS